MGRRGILLWKISEHVAPFFCFALEWMIDGFLAGCRKVRFRIR
jgi:hypothetical protein